MIFKTQFHDHERLHSNPGTPIKIKYSAIYDDSGRLQLEEVGTENLYEYIQSFAESCDIHVLLKRFSNGEIDVLSKVQGMYGDFTQFPNSYADLLNTVNRGEMMFADLPVDVRAKFNHNFAEFMVALSDGTFYDRLGLSSDSVEEPDSVEKPNSDGGSK